MNVSNQTTEIAIIALVAAVMLAVPFSCLLARAWLWHRDGLQRGAPLAMPGALRA
jgi:ABC-type phosphate/phosphonate transport system permease subunit